MIIAYLLYLQSCNCIDRYTSHGGALETGRNGIQPKEISSAEIKPIIAENTPPNPPRCPNLTCPDIINLYLIFLHFILIPFPFRPARFHGPMLYTVQYCTRPHLVHCTVLYTAPCCTLYSTVHGPIVYTVHVVSIC